MPRRRERDGADPVLAVAEPGRRARPAAPRPRPRPAPGAPSVNLYGCLTAAEQPRRSRAEPADGWTVLHAPHAGTYRIAAPYKLPRGTTCPDDLTS